MKLTSAISLYVMYAFSGQRLLHHVCPTTGRLSETSTSCVSHYRQVVRDFYIMCVPLQAGRQRLLHHVCPTTGRSSETSTSCLSHYKQVIRNFYIMCVPLQAGCQRLRIGRYPNGLLETCTFLHIHWPSDRRNGPTPSAVISLIHSTVSGAGKAAWSYRWRHPNHQRIIWSFSSDKWRI